MCLLKNGVGLTLLRCGSVALGSAFIRILIRLVPGLVIMGITAADNSARSSIYCVGNEYNVQRSHDLRAKKHDRGCRGK